MALVLVYLFGICVKKLFLGSLRPVEVAEIKDQLGATLTDTLLAMTIFRGDFDAQFGKLLVCLIFLKFFHWTARLRVDYIAQTISFSRQSLLRLSALVAVLLWADLAFVWHSVQSVLESGVGVTVLFGFEATLLACAAMQTGVHLVLNIVDQRRDGAWHGKGWFALWTDFIAEVFNMLLYVMFFGVVVAYIGRPLHLIRQMYYTYRRFARRVREVANWRRATKDINARFPLVTGAELRAQGSDDVCIICREEMLEGRRLPCGHCIHTECLQSWLQRKQDCPTCRLSVLREDITDESKLWKPPAQTNDTDDDAANTTTTTTTTAASATTATTSTNSTSSSSSSKTKNSPTTTPPSSSSSSSSTSSSATPPTVTNTTTDATNDSSAPRRPRVRVPPDEATRRAAVTMLLDAAARASMENDPDACGSASKMARRAARRLAGKRDPNESDERATSSGKAAPRLRTLDTAATLGVVHSLQRQLASIQSQLAQLNAALVEPSGVEQDDDNNTTTTANADNDNSTTTPIAEPESTISTSATTSTTVEDADDDEDEAALLRKAIADSLLDVTSATPFASSSTSTTPKPTSSSSSSSTTATSLVSASSSSAVPTTPTAQSKGSAIAASSTSTSLTSTPVSSPSSAAKTSAREAPYSAPSSDAERELIRQRRLMRFSMSSDSAFNASVNGLDTSMDSVQTELGTSQQ
eukprot:CAMPEP_0168596922 /NCGR_PEP_ID=MMETSP0420-20121227/10304_1 /TAXON_ID=498008 /ORGANISM="Pessonella sp." /LENGTH=696 /DNA_ID=CAMNT_0008633569 /DNA_START=35 /DNA_END=2122 /DNA_ORIENTATION=-